MKQLATPFGSYRSAQSSEKYSSTFRDQRSGGAAKWLTLMGQQVSIVLSLDLVVFESGKVLGPNDGDTLSALEGFLSGERQAMSILTSAFDRNAPLAEIIQELEDRYRQQRDASDSRNSFARASQFKRLADRARFSKEELVREWMRLKANRQLTLFR